MPSPNTADFRVGVLSLISVLPVRELAGEEFMVRSFEREVWIGVIMLEEVSLSDIGSRDIAVVES